MNNSYSASTLTPWMDHTWREPHADCAQQCVTGQKAMLLHLHHPYPLLSSLHRLRCRVRHTPQSTQTHCHCISASVASSSTGAEPSRCPQPLLWLPDCRAKFNSTWKSFFCISYSTLICSSGFSARETWGNSLKWRLKKEIIEEQIDKYISAVSLQGLWTNVFYCIFHATAQWKPENRSCCMLFSITGI